MYLYVLKSTDMNRYNLICILFLIGAIATAQDHSHAGAQPMEYPDIPGYKTLVTDLHQHTVFSDGSVWPDIRVSCLLYTSPSPRDRTRSRMPSSA